MAILTLTGLPAASVDYGGSPIANVSTGGYGAPLAMVSYKPKSVVATTGTVVLTAPFGGVVTAPSPGGTTTTSIRTPSRTYKPAVDPTAPQPGEFVDDGTDLSIYLEAGEEPTEGSTAIYEGLVDSPIEAIPTDFVPGPHPELYSRWNIVGEVTYQRSFESPPSANFDFTVGSKDRFDVLNFFRNRSVVNLRGMGFEVESCTLTVPAEQLYPSGYFDVKVSLSGKHAYRMEQPVKLLKAAPNRTRGIRYDCPIQQIAALQGLSYEGLALTYPIPKDTDSSATVTLSSALQEVIRLNEGFVFLSNANAVEARKFGQTREHFIPVADVLDESVTYTFNGKEQIYQGVQLAEVFKNSILSPQQDKNEQTTPLLRKTICEPAEDPSIPPVWVTSLADPGMAFDNGGPTKTQRCTKYIGDTEIEATEVTYGFAYCATDVYYFAKVSTVIPGTPPTTKLVPQMLYDATTVPGDYWIPIKQSRITHKYNGYGYHTEIVEQGTRTVRPKTESNRETLDLEIQKQAIVDQLAASGLSPTQSAALTAQFNKLDTRIDAYRFNYVLPTQKVTEYLLQPFGGAYPDTPTPQNDPNIDPLDFVPPYYCQEERTNEFSYLSVPDPDGTAEKPKPPVSTGKSFNCSKYVQLVSTIKGQEAFKVAESTINSEGANLNNGLAVVQTQTVKGRPSPHERAELAMAIYSGLNPPDALNQNPGNTSVFANQSSDPSQYKYVLRVEGSDYPAEDVEQGSQSFNTEDPEKGRLAAEVDLAIRNSQSSETVNLTVRYNSAYQEGDMAWFRGLKYVIFDVSWTEKMELGAVTCPDGMKLTLGRYLRIPVTMTKVPVNQTV